MLAFGTVFLQALNVFMLTLEDCCLVCVSLVCPTGQKTLQALTGQKPPQALTGQKTLQALTGQKTLQALTPVSWF